MKGLKGKWGLIIGIANDKSLAYGCAKVLRREGADLAIMYLNDKAKSYVEPIAAEFQARLFLPLDVTRENQVEDLFQKVSQHFGHLDFIVHSIAYCPLEDLHASLLEVSKEGLNTAMEISVHSLINLTKRFLPLMKEGASIVTMSYIGSKTVIPSYSIMGPIKASLESAVRYLAYELGPRGVRINTLSVGPILTRAASGIKGFEQLLEKQESRAPLKASLTIDDVGEACAFLISNASRSITGVTLYVDRGMHVL